MALSVLSNDNSLDLVKIIKENKNKFVVSADKRCRISLVIYLSQYPQIYRFLSNEVSHHIDSLIQEEDNTKFLCWFNSDSLKKHTDYILDQEEFNITKTTINRLVEHYLNHGENNLLFDCFIHLYSCSKSYDSADNIYDNYISHYLSDMSKQQVVKLITVISNNAQIHARRNCYVSNTEIVRTCKDILGSDFDYNNSDYYFKFDEKVLISIPQQDEPIEFTDNLFDENDELPV